MNVLKEQAGDKPRSIRSYIGLTIRGFCMGAADVVPGVSGGTMAFILGIYEELLEAIRSFDLQFLRLLIRFKFKDAFINTSWRFLTALFVGIFLAVFSLAKLLSWLLLNHPVLIWSFFFGLVLASVYTVGRHLQKWNLPIVGWMFMGTVGSYFLVGLVPLKTPDSPWFLFLSGAVAICAMILPGISGSFILVLLGKYTYLLEAVNNRDFLTLLLAAAGAGFGLITFVRCLNWLLKRYRDPTLAILTGLMLGALRKVWPWKKTLETMTDNHGNILIISQSNTLPATWNQEVTLAIGLIIVGFFVVFILNLRASK
jgi:putative membrane protein